MEHQDFDRQTKGIKELGPSSFSVLADVEGRNSLRLEN
jgi:hypothetical protein